jgi:hypothetical protein
VRILHLAALVLGAIPPVALPLEAQSMPAHPMVHAGDSTRRWSGGAMAIGVVTHATPGALGVDVTEGYLTQPMLLGTLRLADGALVAIGTLNLEGLTLRRGEINPGIYGEGFIDRRHPHTYLHEAMLGTIRRAGPLRLSVFAGKGFVPFGTDDPMVRPFVKYPVNHHLAQVMERALVVGAVQVGRAAVEFARFNGDEPEGPGDWPNAGRALDSWATRVTASAPGALELSASQAHLVSPEYATGAGLDQAKSSASARVARDAGVLRYLLVEWARTRELDAGGRTNFRFTSLLAETSLALGGAQLAARVERTERPEEDRLDDPYRSVRPLLDFNILGRTRWEIVTLAASAPSWNRRWAMATPFVEAAWLRPRAQARPAAIDPVDFYSARTLWNWSAGVRVHAGTMRRRFGRYGAALLPVS